MLPWAVAIAGLGLGIAGILASRRAAPAAAPAPVTRFTIPIPAAGEFDGFPAVSPDGRSIAFSFVPERNVRRLWLHSLDSGESRELRSTEHGGDPFWSPDGRHLGFSAAGELKRIEVASGLVQTVAAVSDARGATWSENGEIYFAPPSSAGLRRVAAGGGEVRSLTEPATGAQSHRFPWALPGGKALLYFEHGGSHAGIHWLDIEGGENRLLASGNSRVHFDRSGYLFRSQKGSLVGQPFDPHAGTLAGEAFVVAEQVGVDAQKVGLDLFGGGPGVVAYRRGGYRKTRLCWIDRGGEVLGEVTTPGDFGEPALSADGSRVVATKVNESGKADTWIFDTSGRDRGLRLSFEGDTSTPVWSANDRFVYFGVESGSKRRLVAKRADGSGAEEVIFDGDGSFWADSESPSAPLLVVEGRDATSGYRLWLLPLEGERRMRPFQQESGGSQAHAAFSPDGRLIAYTSDEGGPPQIYVQPVEGTGVRWQVSTAGGGHALWRADGKELYYVGLDRVLRAVPVSSLSPFTAGEAVELFPLRMPQLAPTGNRSFYSPAPDGQRFLVLDLVTENTDSAIHVILNWTPPEPVAAQ
jgi:Tol biopolymer transport system component